MEIKTWKLWLHFVAYFMCFALAGTIAAIPRIIVGFENESGVLVFFSELLRIPISIAFLYLYTRYISRIPINKESLSITSFNPLKWGFIGVLLPVAVLGIFYISGNFTLVSTNFQIDQGRALDVFLKVLGMSLAAGIVEEIVFRGYLVNLLAKKYSFWVSGLIPSFLFTIIHIGAAESLLNVFQLLVAGMLVSVMFLVIYKKTGSIWNASMIHFLWNLLFLQEFIDYGAGNETVYKLIQIDLGQNEILTGGGFGLDVSLPAIIVYTITLVICWKYLKAKNAD